MSRDLVPLPLPPLLKVERMEEAEPTLMPPWPDAFAEKLMKGLSPFWGYAMTLALFDRMLGTVSIIVQVCVAKGILGSEALCREAILDGRRRVIAVTDFSISPNPLVLEPDAEAPSPPSGLLWKTHYLGSK